MATKSQHVMSKKRLHT